MKKVLYISNIEVPYRTEFFNQLSDKVDLTVLYERKKSSNRDEKWTNSAKSKYFINYLNGIPFKNEYTLDIKILKYVFSKKYDKVVLGCCNSPSQMLAILFMKIFRKKYILNLDGEYFLDGMSIKKIIKRFFIKGAEKYLIAGEKSAVNLSKYVSKEKIFPYYFSSLTVNELEENAKHLNVNVNNKVLVVGQYFEYKGLDIALEIAKLDQSINYRFVGSGKRSQLLIDKVNEMGLKNVEVIPFLQKEELYKEYQQCKCLLLPSRQECWGLVVNEAASFGCPIIGSLGAGAVNEFYSDDFSNYFFDPNQFEKCLKFININDNNYKKYLLNKNKDYNIEKNCSVFLEIFN